MRQHLIWIVSALVFILAASPTYAQLGTSSVPDFAPQTWDPQSVGTAAPRPHQVAGGPSIPSPSGGQGISPGFTPPGMSGGPGFTPPIVSGGTFEIVNQFDYPVYFQLGDGQSFFPTQLDGYQSQVYRAPPGRPVYAAIDTGGQFQVFPITPGMTFNVWLYQGWYVISP